MLVIAAMLFVGVVAMLPFLLIPIVALAAMIGFMAVTGWGAPPE